MKQTILAFVLLLSIGAYAQGENCPGWDSITVTTSEAGQLITIQAARGEGRLTNLVVQVGTNSICVPSSALKDTPDPQFNLKRAVTLFMREASVSSDYPLQPDGALFLGAI